MENIEQLPKSIDELIEQIRKGNNTKETILQIRRFEFSGKTYSFLDENEELDLVANIEFLGARKKESITYCQFNGNQIGQYRINIKVK